MEGLEAKLSIDACGATEAAVFPEAGFPFMILI
jgi:hypothetical protein